MKNSTLMLLVGMCLSCTPPKQVTDSTEDVTLVKLEKQGCRGYCPKYTLRVSTNRMLFFQGERNVAFVGDTTREISVPEYETLVKMLRDDASVELDSLYDDRVVDVPFTHLWIHGEQGVRKVSCRGDAPEPFGRIVDYLEELAQEGQWLEQVEGPKELLVELTDPTQALQLEESFQEMELKLVRRVSPRQNYFVYKADTQLVDASVILERLQKSRLVKKVQWNRTINRRD